MYLTDKKVKVEKSGGFWMFLRKHLINARLREIRQIDSESIIDFLFETKMKNLFL